MTNREFDDIKERIAKVEVEVSHILSNQEEAKVTTHDLNHKIDELLALRNKGAGVFWFITLLAGTGIFGAFTFFANLLRGN